MNPAFYARLAAAAVLAFVLPSLPAAETPKDAYTGVLDFPDPTTVQLENRVFVTTGYIRLMGDRARAESLISDISRWRDWMLVGMDGPRDDGKKLLVYLVDMVWKPAEGDADGATDGDAVAGEESERPSGTLDVMAILPFMKSFGADPSDYRFSARFLRAEDGSLNAVVIRFVDGPFALRDAEYEIAIEDPAPSPGPDDAPADAAVDAAVPADTVAPVEDALPADVIIPDSFLLRYRARVRIHGLLDFFFSLRSYRRTIGWYLDRIARNFAIAWNAIP